MSRFRTAAGEIMLALQIKAYVVAAARVAEMDALRGGFGCHTVSTRPKRRFVNLSRVCEAAFGGERAIKQANFRLLPVSRWGNWVKPTQTAKPRKIAVCGAQRKPVFRS